MKIDGRSCPKCGKLYFGLPECTKCGWRDEGFYAWCNKQLEICRELEKKYQSSVTKVNKE